MYQLIIVIHVLIGLAIIGLIMIQQGKGADAGATFGGGASGSVFGAQGSASFLTKTTATLAGLFFATSLGLTVYNSHQVKAVDIMSSVPSVNSPAVGVETKQEASLPLIPEAVKTAPLAAENSSTPVVELNENKGEQAPQAASVEATDKQVKPTSTVPEVIENKAGKEAKSASQKEPTKETKKEKK